MGYFGGPNKALTNPCILRPNWSHVLGGEKRNRRERREEEKRRGRERGDQAKIKAKKVWMLGF